MPGPDELFKQIFEEGTPLPGGRAPAVGERPPVQRAEWYSNPIVKTINGRAFDFYTIGQLAEALGLKPVTVRKWETMGWLPRPLVHTPPPKWNLPGKRPAGKRLWTRGQVEGIVRIAREEGMLQAAHLVPSDKSAFTQRIVALFNETMREIKEQH
jgi:hypothetical protein